MTKAAYHGDFSSWKDVQKEFNTDYKKPDRVYFATYDHDGYDGSAYVYFRVGEKYYYVYGGHCSCHGLEDQFTPEEFETRELFIAWLRRQIEFGDSRAKSVKRMVVAESK